MGDEGKKKAVALARYFRRNGVESLVEFSPKSLKNQFGRAGKLGAAWVCVVGEDEIRKGLFQLKDMAAGIQTEGAPGDLLKIILDKNKQP
jgi:histidyl-tRNA synthetase